jgi:hypothetical protein
VPVRADRSRDPFRRALPADGLRPLHQRTLMIAIEFALHRPRIDRERFA